MVPRVGVEGPQLHPALTQLWLDVPEVATYIRADLMNNNGQYDMSELQITDVLTYIRNAK